MSKVGFLEKASERSSCHGNTTAVVLFLCFLWLSVAVFVVFVSRAFLNESVGPVIIFQWDLGWMRLVFWELLTSSKSTWMYMYRHDSACKLHSCTVMQWWALHKTTTVWLFEVVSCALENSSAYQHYFQDSFFSSELLSLYSFFFSLAFLSQLEFLMSVCYAWPWLEVSALILLELLQVVSSFWPLHLS